MVQRAEGLRFHSAGRRRAGSVRSSGKNLSSFAISRQKISFPSTFQSVIKMGGFRSLAQDEIVEFECKESGKGLEATRVSGPSEAECQGSDFKPKPKKRFRKVRCYNCGEFANHLAKNCAQGSLPKRCHHCKKEDHLVADCPLKEDKPEKSDKSVGESEETVSEPN